MTEVSLESIAQQIECLLAEQRLMRNQLADIQRCLASSLPRNGEENERACDA